jgi:hypothetical protein
MRVSFGAAKLVIHLMMVDDIITVCAARHGLEVGRTIEMADAEFREIVNNGCGVVKTKTSMKLNSISFSHLSRHDVSV